MKQIPAIAYVVSDLKRVGPSNQTLNIIKNSGFKNFSFVITLFSEPEDSMLDEYLKEGIEVISLSLNRKLFMLTGKRKLERILINKKVDIVHSYGVKPDAICQKVCKKIGVKHVITLRNYPKEDIISRMGFLRGKIALHTHLKVLKKAKYIVACSKTIERRMKQDYPNMNIVAIQNGVDLEKYKRQLCDRSQLRKKLELPTDAYIVISTSSFIRRKRINECIEGFLKSADKKTVLVLLGTGELYETLFDKHGKNSQIIFKGKKDNVGDYLLASDLFISSSESEGLPNGVIEAIASGLPVLLSNISQHTEILEEIPYSGDTYILGNIDDLAKKLQLMTNYDNSKSSIKDSCLTMEKMGKRYGAYYKEMMNENAE